ncbi:uncharacterized protein EV422DRAFT_521191 [Fimicolochytrium jonesii]|uniref:uncharacterized protein n=1 Tax=Fimicolochytrium jonesii TaxID=1396493 RepID=UPI0022FE2840|nr:uncharacterized protein EV422DRAFT_521191 [Fimicolochytrium jonesii]KAI8823487.1 hypothetical protein EV422DRAFT_521191 [Fimicolochytrium jonesii]
MTNGEPFTGERTWEQVGVDVTGFVYCPPGWDEQRLRAGPDAEAIGKIAMDTYTDISYIKEKNAIQISGETHDDVYKAQNQLNELFFPVIVKSKRQWARPDRPGVWGQRRDVAASAGGRQGGGLRKMKSESALQASRPAFHHNAGGAGTASPYQQHYNQQQQPQYGQQQQQQQFRAQPLPQPSAAPRNYYEIPASSNFAQWR